MDPLTLNEVNALDEIAFIRAFGSVYEHTPEVAAEAWLARPFSDLANLTEVMNAIVAAFDRTKLLKLIRNHPQLGRAAELTPASREEQFSAGLTQLEHVRAAELARLNDEHFARFEFPFVVAVKLLHGRDVLEVLKLRLANDVEAEIRAAIEEIAKIASLRLKTLITG